MVHEPTLGTARLCGTRSPEAPQAQRMQQGTPLRMRSMALTCCARFLMHRHCKSLKVTQRQPLQPAVSRTSLCKAVLIYRLGP